MTEFVLFTVDGKYIKTIFIPLIYKNFIEPYPYTIHNDHIYIFVENDAGDWELSKRKIL